MSECYGYDVEKTLMKLMASVGERFSESEKVEVEEFIDAGEYGLALDVFMDIVEEESKKISLEEIEMAKKAAKEMGIDSGAVENKLLRCTVSDNYPCE
jgi:lipoate-protein ligase A